MDEINKDLIHEIRFVLDSSVAIDIRLKASELTPVAIDVMTTQIGLMISVLQGVLTKLQSTKEEI